MTATTYFLCVRAKSNPGPRLYPVVKRPDGSVTEATWDEYHAWQADQQVTAKAA